MSGASLAGGGLVGAHSKSLSVLENRAKSDRGRYPKWTSGHDLMKRQARASRHGGREQMTFNTSYQVLGLVPSFGPSLCSPTCFPTES